MSMLSFDTTGEKTSVDLKQLLREEQERGNLRKVDKPKSELDVFVAMISDLSTEELESYVDENTSVIYQDPAEVHLKKYMQHKLKKVDGTKKRLSQSELIAKALNKQQDTAFFEKLVEGKDKARASSATTGNSSLAQSAFIAAAVKKQEEERDHSSFVGQFFNRIGEFWEDDAQIELSLLQNKSKGTGNQKPTQSDLIAQMLQWQNQQQQRQNESQPQSKSFLSQLFEESPTSKQADLTKLYSKDVTAHNFGTLQSEVIEGTVDARPSFAERAAGLVYLADDSISTSKELSGNSSLYGYLSAVSTVGEQDPQWMDREDFR